MCKVRWFVATLLTLALYSAHCAPPKSGGSFDDLIETTVRRGPDAQLPPHLSVVLGLSAFEQSTAVKQTVIREGAAVHVFNVCAANHRDLVILTHNDRDQSTKAYLVSTDGHLRKAVFFRGSEPAELRSTAEAREDFSAEQRFWMDFSSRLPSGQ